MSTPSGAAENAARRLCDRMPTLDTLSRVDRIRLAEELQDAIDDGVAAELEDADEGWPAEGSERAGAVYLTGAEVA